MNLPGTTCRMGSRSSLLALVPVLRRLPPALLRLDHWAAGHAEVGELAGHEGLHHLDLAHHAHAADGAHHVAAHLELLHELADLVQLDAGAAGDAPPAGAVEEVGLLALLLAHRVVDGAHAAHLPL